MGIIAKPLGHLLEFIYSLCGNYGITLIILTILVKIFLYPLYVKQIRSTANMADFQPKMKEIQEKYKDDKEKMNQALADLYAKEKFNPMGGCLPMVIQMPIIIGLFALLRNPMRYIENSNMIFATHEHFLWIKDLAQPDLWILPIIAGVSTYFSFSMTQSLTNADMMSQTKSMTMVMKYFFPLSILWLARAYPAGLAIYWAGGQFLQIFFNIRMNKYRREVQEASERKRKVEIAEKILAKKKQARMKGLKR